MVQVLFTHILRKSWHVQEILPKFPMKGLLMKKFGTVGCKSLSDETLVSPL